VQSIPFAIVCLFLSLFCNHTEASSGDLKPRVHSFDVFDTLVGRLHKSPRSIFRIVEKEYPFPGFANLRIEAAKRASRGTLEEIYRKLMAMGNLSNEEAEKLKAFEIATDINNVFPITSNLSKVKDGDLLVSDTYYNSDELAQILKKTGLDKEIHLFATCRGKSRGTIWPELQERFEIISHLGNSKRSDVESPSKNEIQSILYTKSRYSSIEKAVYKAGQEDLAQLMRVLRLINPHPENSTQWEVWNEQSQFNVPLLILGSLKLNEVCKKRNLSSVLFSARGCCHFIKIFSHLFPTYDSTYFYTSRYMYRHPTREFVRYVKSLYSPSTIIVDEHGTGSSCRKLFKKHFSEDPNYFILAFCSTKPTEKVGSRQQIEHTNVDRRGSVLSFDKNGPILAPFEYKTRHVQPAHDCIDKTLSLLDHYSVTTFDPKLFDYLILALKKSKPALKRHYVLFHKK